MVTRYAGGAGKKRAMQMDEETKKLIRKLLAQEEGDTQAGMIISKQKKSSEKNENPKEQDPEKKAENKKRSDVVPLWEKYALTITEAAQYFNVTRNRIYRMIEKDKNASFIIRDGKHVLIKRRMLEDYLDGKEEY